MIKKVLWIVFVGMLFFALPATAQEETTWHGCLLNSWPEYDKPEMLVMYDITLPANTRLPATVTIKIPAAAGEPSRRGRGEVPHERHVLVRDRLARGSDACPRHRAT